VSAPTPRRAAKLTRRRFVALAGASLAAMTAGVPVQSAAAEAPAPHAAKKSGTAKTKPPAATGAPSTAQQKEFERQKQGTLAALKTIRAYPLPPGGDLPVVFRPLRTPKKGR
jgi:hypothetical protein